MRIFKCEKNSSKQWSKSWQTTQHNATQRNATQRNTTQHNTTQHNTTHRIATQRNTTQRNTTQHNLPSLAASIKSTFLTSNSKGFKKINEILNH